METSAKMPIIRFPPCNPLPRAFKRKAKNHFIPSLGRKTTFSLLTQQTQEKPLNCLMESSEDREMKGQRRSKREGNENGASHLLSQKIAHKLTEENVLVM